MTKERAAELLPVIKAFAEEKPTQYEVATTRGLAWRDVVDELDISCNLRIKPEPKLRPFTQKEACRFRWFSMQSMDDCRIYAPVEFDLTSILLFSQSRMSYFSLLDRQWKCSIDGSEWQKCGVECE